MSGPKADAEKKETEIRRKEDEAKYELSQIVPLINEVPTESIDDELIEKVDQACKSAREKTSRVKGKNGIPHAD